MWLSTDYVTIPKDWPIQPAERLVPLNFKRLPSYVAGSISFQKPQSGNAGDLLKKPLHNLQVGVKYIRSAHNLTHRLRRIAEVTGDTARVNLISEFGAEFPIDNYGYVEPMSSGIYDNWVAEKYERAMKIDLELLL